MAAIGLLGGTFNPPHLAHLVCAMEARDQLGLDAVRLIPAGVPPHKEVPSGAGAVPSAVRAELCELAAGSEPGLEVLRLEVDRPGPSYTVDTLTELHAASPGNDLIFIVGGDQAHGLPDWKDPEGVLSLAWIAVANRGDTSPDVIRERCAGLAGADDRLVFFSMPRLDVSSTTIRDRVAAGRPIRHLVPAAVADRIAADGLYA